MHMRRLTQCVRHNIEKKSRTAFYVLFLKKARLDLYNAL
jgi:hypothetical protein